jgi:hypothetical protein
VIGLLCLTGTLKGLDDFDRIRSYQPDLNGTPNAVSSDSSSIPQKEVRIFCSVTA